MNENESKFIDIHNETLKPYYDEVLLEVINSLEYILLRAESENFKQQQEQYYLIEYVGNCR